MATDITKLMEIGEKMNLKGDELKTFIKEQQQWETQRASEQNEAIRSQRNEERELQKLKLEQEKIKTENLEKEIRLQELRAEGDSHNTSLTSNSNNTGAKLKLPQLPPFDPKDSSVITYITRFERYFEVSGYSSEKKAIVLSSYLRGESLEVFHRLDSTQCNDYEVLKAALLKRFGVTPEKCRTEFKNMNLKYNETYPQFKVRMETNLQRWLKISNKNNTFEDLFDLIISDEMMKTFPPELRVFVKERGQQTQEDMIKTAESWRTAHPHQMNRHLSNTGKGSQYRHTPKPQDSKPMPHKPANNTPHHNNNGRYNTHPPSQHSDPHRTHPSQDSRNTTQNKYNNNNAVCRYCGKQHNPRYCRFNPDNLNNNKK